MPSSGNTPRWIQYAVSKRRGKRRRRRKNNEYET